MLAFHVVDVGLSCLHRLAFAPKCDHMHAYLSRTHTTIQTHTHTHSLSLSLSHTHTHTQVQVQTSTTNQRPSRSLKSWMAHLFVVNPCPFASSSQVYTHTHTNTHSHAHTQRDVGIVSSVTCVGAFC
jgi:hypothetical protein